MKRLVVVLALLHTLIYASSFSEGIQAFKQQNYQEALELFKEAFYEDDAVNAGYFLGKIYLEGLGGIKKDLNLAETFLKAAADSGNLRAQCLLAEVYLEKYNNIEKAKSLIQNNNMPDCRQVKEKLGIKG